MRPKFWYCPLCGYMFIDMGGDEAVKGCPRCGEDVMPCWECIARGTFDKNLCQKCEKKSECQPRFATKLPFSVDRIRFSLEE